MAFATMRHRIYQIIPTVPLLALFRHRLQRPLGEEQRAPEHHQQAPTEGRRRLVRLIRLRYWWLRGEIGVQIGNVPIGHPGKGGEWKDRKEMSPIRPDTLAQRVAEV